MVDFDFFVRELKHATLTVGPSLLGLASGFLMIASSLGNSSSVLFPLGVAVVLLSIAYLAGSLVVRQHHLLKEQGVVSEKKASVSVAHKRIFHMTGAIVYSFIIALTITASSLQTTDPTIRIVLAVLLIAIIVLLLFSLIAQIAQK